MTFSRIYRDDEGNWQDSSSFGRDDLLLVGKVADRVHSWVFDHRESQILILATSDTGTHISACMIAGSPMWLLVLVKLVAPPLFHVPLPVFGSTKPADGTAQRGGCVPNELKALRPRDVSAAPVGPSALTTSVTDAAWPRVSWKAWLLAIWLAGSFLWFVMVGVRTWKFARRLQHAEPAPASLRHQAARLARRFALRDRPES